MNAHNVLFVYFSRGWPNINNDKPCRTTAQFLSCVKATCIQRVINYWYSYIISNYNMLTCKMYIYQRLFDLCVGGCSILVYTSNKSLLLGKKLNSREISLLFRLLRSRSRVLVKVSQNDPCWNIKRHPREKIFNKNLLRKSSMKSNLFNYSKPFLCIRVEIEKYYFIITLPLSFYYLQSSTSTHRKQLICYIIVCFIHCQL